MKRTMIALLALSMLGATACKSSPSQTDEAEPTTQSEMSESTAESKDEAEGEAEKALTEQGDEKRAGPHGDQMQVRLVGQPTVEGPGTLSPTAIRDIAEKRQERTTTCFKSFPGDIEEPSRQVMLTLRLSRDGAVLEVQSSAQDELGQCVAAEVESWEFPKPEGGEVESTIEFEYGPSGEASEGGEQGVEEEQE